MKKWVKYLVAILCSVAACMTIFGGIKDMQAEKDTTTDTGSETACVAVIDM